MRIWILILLPLVSHGQLIDELPRDENGNLFYSEVIQVEGKDKKDIYLIARQFFVDVFKSANNVIQNDNEESGIISGKGFSNVSVKIMGVPNVNQMWYTIKIQCRDGRYKCEIYDIYFNSSPDPNTGRVTTNYPKDIFDKKNYYKKNGNPNAISEQFKNEVNRTTSSLFISLRSVMDKSSQDKKDDW